MRLLCRPGSPSLGRCSGDQEAVQEARFAHLRHSHSASKLTLASPKLSSTIRIAIQARNWNSTPNSKPYNLPTKFSLILNNEPSMIRTASGAPCSIPIRPTYARNHRQGLLLPISPLPLGGRRKLHRRRITLHHHQAHRTGMPARRDMIRPIRPNHTRKRLRREPMHSRRGSK